MSGDLPPCSPEAEEAVIGAALINPELMHVLVTFLSADMFMLMRHNIIWQAFMWLWERAEPIDYLTVVNRLKEMGKLDEIGGAAYLTLIINNTPTSINGEMYGRLVQRTAQRRKMLNALDTMRSAVLNEELSLEASKSQADAVWLEATSDHAARTITPFFNLVDAYYEEWTRRYDNKEANLGLPTGLRDLDNLTLGLHKSDLIFIVGEQGMGKTALLGTIACNALKFGCRVGWLSLEMTEEQVTQRIIAAETGLSMQKLRVMNGFTPQEAMLLADSMDAISKYQLYVDDTPSLNPMEARAKANLMMHRYGLDLLIIDFVQLMNGGPKFGQHNDEKAELTAIAYGLKGIAKDLNIPVLAAVQPNRRAVDRKDKHPMKSDLRGSSGLVDAPDTILGIYRDVVHNPMTEFPNQADISIIKQRNGPPGIVSVYYDGAATRFLDAAVRTVDLNEDLPVKDAKRNAHTLGKH